MALLEFIGFGGLYAPIDPAQCILSTLDFRRGMLIVTNPIMLLLLTPLLLQLIMLIFPLISSYICYIIVYKGFYVKLKQKKL